ncbi:MAG: glycosyltransferase family 39 protein [Saprospiraceae bacterium]|nr:glycosyltransferase family 39 protein [Saprospiraceae bacterium]
MKKNNKITPKGKIETTTRATESLKTSAGFSTNQFAYIIVALAVIFLIIVRVRLSSTALERDEGEFGYIAQLILAGDSPFTAYNYKIPGVSYIYALFIALFGSTKEAIHFCLLFFNVGTTIVLYLALSKRFQAITAALAAAVYAVLSTCVGTLGHAAHATQFLNFFAILGLFLSLKFLDSRKLYFAFLSGLSLGISFLMKQPAIFFIAFVGIFTVCSQWLKKENKWSMTQIITFCLLFGAGILIPYLGIVALSVSYGQFDLFWKWTYEYPKQLAGILTFSQGMDTLKIMITYVTKGFSFLWIIGILGWIISFFFIKNLPRRIFIALFVLLSLLSITPGLYFRNHYFITMLPALALGFGLFFEGANKFLENNKISAGIGVYAIALLAVLIAIGKNADYYFKDDTETIVKKTYGSNPFNEMEKIASYISSNSTPNDKIAVFGSEAEVYYYSKRRAATGYLFVYEMMKNQPNNMLMQKEMLREIEKNDPEYLLLSNVDVSWGRTNDAPDSLSVWFNNAVNTRYNVVGVADIINNETIYKFDAEVADYRPQSKQFVAIFRKRKS